MSARIPPGFAELWFGYNIASDPETMFIALGVDLAPGETATQVAANDMLGVGIAELDNVASNAYTLGPGHVIFGNDGGDIRIDGNTTPVPGLRAGEALPPNCAMLVRKLTASGGRRNRGRMYVPAVTEADVGSLGVINTAWQATVNAAMNALYIALVNSARIDQIVLFHDTAPFTPTVVTGLELQPKIATQRRRLRP